MQTYEPLVGLVERYVHHRPGSSYAANTGAQRLVPMTVWRLLLLALATSRWLRWQSCYITTKQV
jgi:hypothetical protein